MQRSLLQRFRPTRALLWKLVIFVAVSGTFRATEHYVLYSLHPSVTADTVVVDASGTADGGRDEAVRLYESVRNATLSVSGALIALTAVAVFSHRGEVNGEPAAAPACGRPVGIVIMHRPTPAIPRPRKEVHHARRVYS